ncbi:hypothetical protein H7200_02670 [Candidatus Saccharibacteria bacterium]|nr:hypothetical protein [Candidatus Saccharibacteria bacterium]
MALFVRQDENRTELQQRLATELQARARDKAKQTEQPDGIEDSAFIKGTKQTSSLAWVWGIVFLLVVAAIIFLVIQSSK